LINVHIARRGSLQFSSKLQNVVIVTGVVALNGLLYVVGGDDGTSNLASVEVYNPKTDSWSMLPSSMGIGRSYAGVAIIDKPM